MTDAVILLHGIARTSYSMRAVERHLTGLGYHVLNVDYPSRAHSLTELVDKIHPVIAAAALGERRTHFIGYSMGGLITRAYLHRHRPQNLGRVVMLGTPNKGSEVADFLKNNFLFRWFYGPAGQELTTAHDHKDLLGKTDYEVGVIAGSRPIDFICGSFILPGPNDGKVTIASTHLEGEKDHITLRVSHTFMPTDGEVVRQTAYFLEHGAFDRGGAEA